MLDDLTGRDEPGKRFLGLLLRSEEDCLETGLAGALAKRSVKDGMQVDHSPSHKSNVLRREQELGRPLTEDEEQEVWDKGTAVLVRNGRHTGTSRIFGGRNTKDIQREDVRDPLGAIERDIGTYRDRDSDENAQRWAKVIKELQDLFKKTNPKK